MHIFISLIQIYHFEWKFILPHTNNMQSNIVKITRVYIYEKVAEVLRFIYRIRHMISNNITSHLPLRPGYCSPGRGDRSGAQIHDLLFAKAYCIKHNYEYIGCPIKGFPIRRSETKKLVKYLNITTGNCSTIIIIQNPYKIPV